MDSRDVNKEIKLQVKPLLQRAGFTNFTSRTAWRYQTHQIDVINFQSFNSYFAAVAGCTTYSFAVNLGCYLTYIPERYPSNRTKVKKNNLVPEEYRCHTRRHLQKHLDQPEFKRRDIWYVDPDGKYLGPAVHDAALAIEAEAWKWFERWSDASELLRALQSPDTCPDGEDHGFGANPSPKRSYLTAYTAMNLNRPDIAVPHFERILRSRPYEGIWKRLEADWENALEARDGRKR